MKLWKTASIAFIGYAGYKMIVVVHLKYFDLKEFRGEWLWLSTGVMRDLEAFRENLGRKVMISPAPGSIIRFNLEEGGDHVLGRAIDVMLPEGPDLETAFNVARKSGFNAIGIYPQWKPYPGLHLGKRPGDKLYTWAGIKNEKGQQVYVSLERGLQVERGLYA